MALSEDDREWLSLTMENAHLKAFDKHKSEDHQHLEEKVDKLSGKVSSLNHWIKAALATALGAVGINFRG